MESHRLVSIICVLLYIILISVTLSEANQYFVGGSKDIGWNDKPKRLSYNHWSKKTKFAVNDTIVFTYPLGKDKVLYVREEDYKKCNNKNPVKTWYDGYTEVNLFETGIYYFIGGNDGSCQKGQRLIVFVPEDQSPPTELTPATPPSLLSPPLPSPPLPTQTPPSPAARSPAAAPSPLSPAAAPSPLSPAVSSPPPPSPAPHTPAAAPSPFSPAVPSTPPPIQTPPSPAAAPTPPPTQKAPSLAPSINQPPESSPPPAPPTPTAPSPSATAPQPSAYAPAPAPSSAWPIAAPNMLTLFVGLLFGVLFY